MKAALALGILVVWVSPARPDDAPGTPDPIALADSVAAPDSAAADSSAAPREPFRADSAWAALARYRIERSVEVEEIPFGLLDDPFTWPGLQTLADVLRLFPETRTRELSQGPTAQTWALDGAGSARAGLILGSRSHPVPSTSGPHTQEVALSEIGTLRVLRGGGAALYGPDAVSGAAILDPAFPFPAEVTSRAFGEEGVDEYQRAGFQIASGISDRAGFFLTTESRRFDGFFPGTKENSRHFAGRVAGRGPRGVEAGLAYRRFEGDGRFGGFNPNAIGTVVTKRSDWETALFHPLGPGRGALFEIQYAGQTLETVDVFLGPTTRVIQAPLGRITSDLPDWAGGEWVFRLEAIRWRVATEETFEVDRFWRGAASLRGTFLLGSGAGFTGTARIDGEQERRRAVQVRNEAWWRLGPVRLHAVASRNERFPDRGAIGDQNEIHHTGRAGIRLEVPRFQLAATAFGTAIDDLRPEPVFEQVRARAPVPDRPIGDGRIAGGTAELAAGRFRVPRLRFLGDLLLRTSFTAMKAELGTGKRLPGRPRRSWTGEGFLERRFFQDELLARVRGRLTHRGDRVNELGEPVVDMWLTEVVLEAEIGDAMFFYRFQDPLSRADEVEPGIRFPGLSRTWGISWRFRG